MSTPLSIALVSPHSWPASDDITWRIAAEGSALARRGHRVTILAPGIGDDLLADGRQRLARLRDGDIDAVLPPPGELLVVPLGRALPAGPRRKVGGPLDLAASLEDVLSLVAFDVVHVHEPLAPSPALAALRHTGGVTAATFYRPEQLAGVAFVRPLVERAVARVDTWIAASESARRAVRELFGRDCTVVSPGVDPAAFPPVAEPVAPPALTIVTRAPDRAGVRFAVSVLRTLDLEQVGPITILGPREAPWRTRAAVPKALRERVTAIADTGADARSEAFGRGGIALFVSPDDLAGSAVTEAMACGLAVLLPRSAETDMLVEHGAEGLVLRSYSGDAWARTVTELLGDEPLRRRLSRGATERVAQRTWDVVAEELDAQYRGVRQELPLEATPVGGRVIADLRITPSGELTPRDIVDNCRARGVDVAAVIATGTIDAAVEAEQAARSRMTIIVGQQIRTSDGEIVGLFLKSTVPDGQDLETTVSAIHGQGGLVMVPHPVWGEPPSHDLLRRHRSSVDCYETLSGPSPTGRAGAAVDATVLAQRFGLLATAGSGATTAEEIGAAHLRMRPFASPREFLDSLVDGEPVQRRRGLRSKMARERRHPAEPAT